MLTFLGPPWGVIDASAIIQVLAHEATDTEGRPTWAVTIVLREPDHPRLTIGLKSKAAAEAEVTKIFNHLRAQGALSCQKPHSGPSASTRSKSRKTASEEKSET